MEYAESIRSSSMEAVSEVPSISNIGGMTSILMDADMCLDAV